MTGTELKHKYGIDAATLLAYMKKGLRAKEPIEEKPVRNFDDLDGEEKRVQNLIEMSNARGQNPIKEGLNPGQSEIYNKLLTFHYISFKLPDYGNDRREYLRQIYSFFFSEKEVLSYYSPADSGEDGDTAVTVNNVGRVDDDKAPKQEVKRSFISKGDYWEVKFDNNSVHLKNLDRIKYITYLLENPFKRFNPSDLYALVKGDAPQAKSLDPLEKSDAQILSDMRAGHKDDKEEESSLKKEGVALTDLFLKDLSDEEKHKLENIAYTQWELSKKTKSDESRKNWEATKLHFSNEYGIKCLESPKGPSFMYHPKDDRQANNARVNTRKNIKNAITDLKNQLPALGDYLKKTIRTGNIIEYTPEDADPVWFVKR